MRCAILPKPFELDFLPLYDATKLLSISIIYFPFFRSIKHGVFDIYKTAMDITS
uniref:Uncharacterized protein n=1 Tax=Lotus japonicus TaxID=34305 RepID=I3SQR3_LOTJA|nr:unknown [Lotus japonicus]